MAKKVRLLPVEALVAHVRDGDQVAIATAFNGEYSGAAMSATRALIRRGAKGLRLLCVPTGSLQADLLVGAGCLASIEMSAVLLYEYGPAPRFAEAQREGTIEVREATCPALSAGLRAGEAGIPFMPMRGLLGSDVFRARDGEWQQMDNPFNPGEPVAIIPAIRPDIALFHVPLADAYGNAWVGKRGSLKLMGRAAKKTLVTFDELFSGNLLEDDDKAPGTLAYEYVTALSHQPGGSWPLHGGKGRPEDREHMREYAEAAATKAGFAGYLRRHVLTEPQAA